MAKYRKKPVVVEAMRFTDETKNQVYHWITCNKIADFERNEPILIIGTLKGPQNVRIGDYVIRGIKGEFYSCRPDIFEETYEKIE